MKSTHYITCSLLNSWKYYLKSQDEYEEKAKEDFLNTLKKVPTPQTEAMLKGIKFENNVFAVTQNKALLEDPIINEVAEIVKGSLWQVPVKKVIQVQDMNILLYGKADCIKEDTIYDVKRSKSYDIGKYLDSTQHLIYMYCTEIPNFQYLVATGSGEDAKDLFKEDYNLTKNTESQVLSVVNEFIGWLRVNNLLDIYLDKWRNKY